MLCFNSNETVSAFVADTVLELMQNGGTGEVLMVNSAGVYLGIGEHIWLLCDISWGAVPIGIAIEGFAEQIIKLRLREGETFRFFENTLIFSKGMLKLRPI